MLINDLPDDCLLEIFNRINVLDVLVYCLNVCQKWEYLINERLKHVKYLVGIPNACDEVKRKKSNQKSIITNEIPVDIVHYEHYNYPCHSGLNDDLIYFKRDYLFSEIDAAKLLPKLQIVDVNDYCESLHRPGCTKIAKLFYDSDSIRGIIHQPCEYGKLLKEYCKNLEMIATPTMKDVIDSVKTDKIKQLFLWYDELENFTEVSDNFPNLERLSVLTVSWSSDALYKGSILEKLKIFELFMASSISYQGIQFVDSCPALQSAYLGIDYTNILIDESIKHYNLENLIIGTVSGFEIEKFYRLIEKYPNLKNLALEDESITDNDVVHLVSTLKKLVLLDFRECRKITVASAEYISKYCKKNNREIKFYFTQMESDYPKLSREVGRIGRGCDFMENCFFGSKPLLLDPMDLT